MKQVYFDTSEICRLHGVKHAVFSPGSRNAPLSISFSNNKKIKTHVIVDERSAGFIALGIAQQTKSPVVLCCTSGTALLNYGPAIAEAYYQHIPLIILSADRPPEWIDQLDGQTIRQQNVFPQYTKGFYQLPVDVDHPDGHWEYQRKISEGILLASSGKQGPVHINIPFREPFYPEKAENLAFSSDVKEIQNYPADKILSKTHANALLDLWNSFEKKIIVLGHGMLTETEIQLLEHLATKNHVPVVNDIISNGHGITGAVLHQDLFLQQRDAGDQLSPELVLMIGQSVISKNLKLFLRKTKAAIWKIGPEISFADPFQQLGKTIEVEVSNFLKLISKGSPQPKDFIDNWQSVDLDIKSRLQKLNELPYSEFSSFWEVLKKLPADCELHLANSMPVRFANFIQEIDPTVRVYANRGTSGIDGTNGTAVGHALSTNRKVVLLTGDLSFLYDRNAFFHGYDLSNLVVIVFNNFGGGIFNLIPGPLNLDEDTRNNHFLTPHSKDMKLVALDAGFSYLKANDDITLDLSLAELFHSGKKPKLLEIQTDHKINQKVYFEIKKQINE